MTPRTGRPPLDPDQRLGAAVPVRFTDEEKQLVEAAAAADETSLSSWIRSKAVAEAKRAKRRN